MFLSAMPLERVSEADLQRLIADGVRESRDLDFKRDPVGDDRDAKREFLRDVTSFANTAGGYLIIGMAEAAGVADALIGLTARPPDDEKLRLENVIRDAVTYTEHARRKTVTALDVVYALKRQGRTLYGFGG